MYVEMGFMGSGNNQQLELRRSYKEAWRCEKER